MSNNVDGSENHLVNIRGLEDYQMPMPESEFHLRSDTNDDDSDGVEYYERETDEDISSESGDSADEDEDCTIDIIN